MMTRTLASFATILLVGGVQPRAFAQSAVPLLIGRELTRDLGTGGVHVYTLPLLTGRFVAGEIDQHSVNVRVSIYDPRGALVFRNSASERGADLFQFNTRTSGDYRLVISSPVGEQGRYSVLVRRHEPIRRAPDARVDQLLSAYNAKTPGAIIRVSRGGKVLFSKSYGMADLGQRSPITSETVFNLASTSKPFTGVAIAQLESEGKLSLNDDVRKYLPEMPDFGTPLAIKHLLWHTSGLRDHWSLWELAGGRPDDRIQHADMLRLVTRQRTLNFAPGSRSSYSNTNYTLLAEIVRRISGHSLGKWLEREVFQPTGMRTAGVVHDADREVPRMAKPYRHVNGGYRPVTLRNEVEGPTNVLMSDADLARWIRAFTNPQTAIGSLRERMTRPGMLNDGKSIPHGYGLGLAPASGHASFGYNGSHSGYRSALRYYPDMDALVIVLSNVESALTGVWLSEITTAFFGSKEPAKEPAEAPAGAAFPQELWTPFSGVYRMAEGDTAAARLVQVERTPEGLAVTLDERAPIATRAIKDGVFAPTAGGHISSVTFEVAEDGRVKGLSVEGDLRGRYVKQPSAQSIDELQDYVGTFWSEELETRYDVRLRGDVLMIEHRRHGGTEMLRVGPDRFQAYGWIYGEISFMRTDGQVAGFSISNFGIENLRFDKQRSIAAPTR